MVARFFAKSVAGKTVWLRAYDWDHIASGHVELRGRRREILETVACPEAVHRQRDGCLIAYRWQPEMGAAIVVIYRESNIAGRIITAYTSLTPNREVKGREKIWPRR